MPNLLHWATSTSAECTMFRRAVHPARNRGLPLDEIEDLLPASSAYRQAARLLFPEPAVVKGRPLTPLHGGHVALCAVSGMLNGIFGTGERRHIAVWQPVKVVDRWKRGRRDHRRPGARTILRMS